MSNPTVAIPQDRLPELEKAIGKLNKKADKLGTAPITIEQGQPFDKQVSATSWATFVPVTINGEAPKLNGWVFVATLEHDENGTLIRRLPAFDYQVDLTQYRKSTPDNCDHCGYKRRRNDTYVVWNEESGDTKQVGSSCLKDFIGHDNPEAIAKHLQSIRDFIESVHGGSYSEGRITPRYDLVSVLSVAAHEINENGYVSRKAAWDDQSKRSTAEVVRTRWHDYLGSEGVQAQITDRDRQAAKTTIDWVRSLTEKDLENEYLYNLFTVYKGDSIEEGQFGIAASGFQALLNAGKRSGDGDRHKGSVTRTDDAPTQAQLDYIAKLAEELDSPYDAPETRLDASDLINTMKAAKAASRELEARKLAHGTQESGATDKQLYRINKRMEDRVMTDKQRKEARAKIDAGLTRSQASKAIDWLESLPEVES